MNHESPLVARRLGAFSSAMVAAVDLLYLIVIGAWIAVSGTPMEPIADPYLFWMEVLTIVSALAVAGLAMAVWAIRPPSRDLLALGALVTGLAGSLTTIGVHFVRLTAVRQLWRSGTVPDYRLVWPSLSFAIEYLAWDFLLGLHMILVALTLRGHGSFRSGPRVLLVGGSFCLMGLVGPISGQMLIQNLAIAGYGILLPIGALLLNRSFRAGGQNGGALQRGSATAR